MGETTPGGLGEPIGRPDRGPLQRFWKWLWPFNLMLGTVFVVFVKEFVASPLVSAAKGFLPTATALPVSPATAIFGAAFFLMAAAKAGFWWAQRTRGVAGGPRWLFGGETKKGRAWEFGGGYSGLLHDGGRLIADDLAPSGRAYWAERSQDARGVHTFGPYLELPGPGQYLAVFYLRISGFPVDGSAFFAGLEAYYSRRGEDTGTILQLIRVETATGDAYESFALRYIVPVDAIRDCLHEWRIRPAIGVSVWLDRITVERLADLPERAA